MKEGYLMFSNGYNNNSYNLWDNYWRSYRINSEAAIQIALQRVPGQIIKVELGSLYVPDVNKSDNMWELKKSIR